MASGDVVYQTTSGLTIDDVNEGENISVPSGSGHAWQLTAHGQFTVGGNTLDVALDLSTNSGSAIVLPAPFDPTKLYDVKIIEH